MIKTLLFALFGLISASLLSQVIANPPDPIILCDVNNPGDETEIFDLTMREAQIINGQPDVVVTYHETSGDALSGTNPFSNPTAYQNIYNPQNVFVRLQSTAGQGWDVTTLELIVVLIPFVAQDPDDIFIDEGDGDGFAVFDLRVNESQVLGSQDPFLFQISYFEVLVDATNNTNPISDPGMYMNITNPQTVYARLAPNQDQCDFEVYDFEISTDGVLSVLDLNVETLELFPNPSSEIINFRSPLITSEVSVYVYDSRGVEVFSEKIRPQEGTLTINIAGYSEGIYFIRLVNETLTFTRRFIKK